MSKDGKSEAKPKTGPTVSNLQTAIKRSVILPRDRLAKSKKSEAPSGSILRLQTEITRSVLLPKDRRVVTETLEKPSKKKSV